MAALSNPTGSGLTEDSFFSLSKVSTQNHTRSCPQFRPRLLSSGRMFTGFSGHSICSPNYSDITVLRNYLHCCNSFITLSLKPPLEDSPSCHGGLSGGLNAVTAIRANNFSPPVVEMALFALDSRSSYVFLVCLSSESSEETSDSAYFTGLQ